MSPRGNTVKECGCVLNPGGWPVSYCERDAREVEEKAARERCPHGRTIAQGCAWCEREGLERELEDRAETYRSWGLPG